MVIKNYVKSSDMPLPPLPPGNPPGGIPMMGGMSMMKSKSIVIEAPQQKESKYFNNSALKIDYRHGTTDMEGKTTVG